MAPSTPCLMIRLMMINYPLFWGFPPVQNIAALPPLGYIFIQAFT
jgi:hypothetical protein